MGGETVFQCFWGLFGTAVAWPSPSLDKGDPAPVGADAGQVVSSARGQSLHDGSKRLADVKRYVLDFVIAAINFVLCLFKIAFGVEKRVTECRRGGDQQGIRFVLDDTAYFCLTVLSDNDKPFLQVAVMREAIGFSTVPVYALRSSLLPPLFGCPPQRGRKRARRAAATERGGHSGESGRT